MSYTPPSGGSLAAYAEYTYEEAAGVDGAATVATAWTDGILNTEVVDAGAIGSLAFNQVTLIAGTYDFEAFKVIYRSSGTRGAIRLWNVTDSALIGGLTPYINPSMLCVIAGRFTIAASKAIALQYYVASSDGIGQGISVSGSLGINEVYSRLCFWKVA